MKLSKKLKISEIGLKKEFVGQEIQMFKILMTQQWLSDY
jgi:hypothetical protein